MTGPVVSTAKSRWWNAHRQRHAEASRAGLSEVVHERAQVFKAQSPIHHVLQAQSPSPELLDAKVLDPAVVVKHAQDHAAVARAVPDEERSGPHSTGPQGRHAPAGSGSLKREVVEFHFIAAHNITSRVRAAPLLRVKVQVTVSITVCIHGCPRPLPAAVLTVNLTLIRTGGVALN